MSKSNRFFVLESGERVRVSPVPSFLLEAVQSRISYPRIPLWRDENGAEWENDGDPDYLAEKQAVEARRMSLAMMAAIIHGVELIDEDGNHKAPPDDGWERKLRFLGVDWRKPADLDGWDDEGDIEFARDASYLLYWLMTQTDIANLMDNLTVAGGGAAKTAEAAFPSDEARPAAKRVSTKRSK